MLKQLLILFSFFLLTLNIYAQQREVTGKVTGNDGAPIPYATIQIKGTNRGTTAGQNGTFRLMVDGNNVVLQVRSIGFAVKEIAVGDNSNLNVTLAQDNTNLEEVIVTGLGIRREKKALGYAVQDVKGDDLVKASQGDALRALSGKVAGLQVVGSGGTPGAATYVKLRGTNSLTGNNQPLFVIDGIPIDNSQNYSGDPSDGTNNVLQGATNTNRGADINPDDIESISVLKGPAAAALYGIDAANGAIIITTKKGKSGRIQVEFSTGVSFDVVNRLPKIQLVYARGTGGKLLPFSSTNRYSWGPRADTLSWTGVPNEYDQHGDVVGRSDPSAKIPFRPYNNTKDFWRTGTTYNNSLSFTGGSDVATYRMSVSHLYQNSIVPTQSLQRSSVAFAGQLKVSEKVKVSSNVNFTTSGGNMPQNGSNLSGIMLGLTRTPITFDNSNGGLKADNPKTYLFSNGLQRSYRNGIYDNPYWTINQNPYTTAVNRIIGNVQMDWGISQDFTLTYRVGTDIYSDNRHQYYEIQSGAYSGGRVFDDRYTYKSVNSDLILGYSKQLSKNFRLDAKVGNNYYSRKLDELYVQGDGLTSPGYDNISNATAQKSYNFVTPYRRASGYFDINLDFMSMLYLEITGRNDWSSTLPKKSNSFFYPSASLGFVFTELEGLKGGDVLSMGKLRLSAAQVGKDPGPFNIRSFFTPTTYPDGYTTGVTFPYNGKGSFSLNNVLGNPDLKPEKTVSYEIGLQLQFLQNRLGLDATYYYSKGTDLLVRSPIAGSTGFQYVTLNAGSIQNKGLEMSLTAKPIVGKVFSWDMVVNYSMNRSKVLKLAPGINQITVNGFTGTTISHLPGKPAGIIYAYGWLRDSHGNIVISDQSGDFGYPVVSTQQTQVGDPNPKFLLGFGNTFTYKGLSLYTLLDWKHKGDMWNGTRGSLMAIGTSAYTLNRGTNNLFQGVLGHLNDAGEIVHNDGAAEKPGTGAANTTAVPLDQAWYQGNGGGFGAQTESFIDDASYIKLREVSLAYDFNLSKFDNGKFIKTISVSAFARNILLWSPYKGIDPETSLTGATNAQGIDYFNMPGTSSYGLNLKFKF
ncbi:SusC/RagA family TonB-linked outer membrane protein [Chitinophaga oryziterrae]|uniref:SusC/RagA family TonB-linked outer membrane protein n=1 Tax=Chitinophaga oryziterrae TaxID=1031224 RepID=A0A6N8J515_9BACT|nr:SusC/RagA family TonB-linked outer membrane protein [Chitinophaga oryziterrae]MVT39366.1 SusC/RagA family TonB-linked outer membrane protein [Chitinophaga oryziterrae]